jgi:hypothetical protein
MTAIMASPSLPLETVDHIPSYLIADKPGYRRTLKNLSSTSSHFRSTISPRFFSKFLIDYNKSKRKTNIVNEIHQRLLRDQNSRTIITDLLIINLCEQPNETEESAGLREVEERAPFVPEVLKDLLDCLQPSRLTLHGPLKPEVLFPCFHNLFEGKEKSLIFSNLSRLQICNINGLDIRPISNLDSLETPELIWTRLQPSLEQLQTDEEEIRLPYLWRLALCGLSCQYKPWETGSDHPAFRAPLLQDFAMEPFSNCTIDSMMHQFRRSNRATLTNLVLSVDDHEIESKYYGWQPCNQS